jgi:RimJ/RimL family protein N-acetyltransferase
MSSEALATGGLVHVRKLIVSDLGVVSDHPYSVSITEPASQLARLVEIHDEGELWLEESGAVAIVETQSQRMVGTLQFYRSAPCIHGIEIGYLVHDPADRGKGYAAEALRLFSDLLFSTRPSYHRQQLIIEVWNTASWKVAERSGFVREGILRSSGFGEGDRADSFVYSRTRKDRLQELASLLQRTANGPG